MHLSLVTTTEAGRKSERDIRGRQKRLEKDRRKRQTDMREVKTDVRERKADRHRVRHREREREREREIYKRDLRERDI